MTDDIDTNLNVVIIQCEFDAATAVRARWPRLDAVFASSLGYRYSGMTAVAVISTIASGRFSACTVTSVEAG